jgi:hypothetical protein
MDEWTPFQQAKPTTEQIEDYMKSLELPEIVPNEVMRFSDAGIWFKSQKGANSKQVAGSHYSDKEIQPWDYIHANNLCYFTGNCVKYVSRWRDKGGIDDLKKAIHYLEKLIELEEGK